MRRERDHESHQRRRIFAMALLAARFEFDDNWRTGWVVGIVAIGRRSEAVAAAVRWGSFHLRRRVHRFPARSASACGSVRRRGFLDPGRLLDLIS